MSTRAKDFELLYQAGKRLILVMALCLLASWLRAETYDSNLAYLGMGGGIQGGIELLADVSDHQKIEKPISTRQRLIAGAFWTGIATVIFQRTEGRTWVETGNELLWAETGAFGCFTVSLGSRWALRVVPLVK